MIDLIRQVVQALVEHPEAVQVAETPASQCTVLELSVHPEDMRHVIGRNGETAAALRKIAGSIGGKAKQRVRLEIMSAGGRHSQMGGA